MRIKLVFILGLLLSIGSCQQQNHVFSEFKSVGGKWHKNDSLSFIFSPKDTLQTHDVYIQLRNNFEYEFKNIFLISSISFPNGKVIVDTLEYPMAYNDGRFMGKGTNVIENKLWLKEQVRFNEIGDYEFKLQQACRKTGEVEPITELKGILDVGIQIEEIQVKNEK